MLYILLLAMLMLLTQPAGAELTPDEVIDEQLAALDLQTLDRELARLSTDLKKFTPALNMRSLITGLLQGEIPLQAGPLLNSLVQIFFGEVIANAQLLGKILILAVICSLLQVLIGAFGRAEVGFLARAVTHLVFLLLVINSLQGVMGIARGAVTSMVEFMTALFPFLMTMLLGMGAVASAALFKPLIFMSITVIGNLISSVILPFIFFAGLLTVVNSISKEFRVQRLIGLIKELGVGMLGAVLVVFVGLLALQGAAGAVGDGLTLRTAKYLTGAFVPVLGSMFADAVELIAGCSLMIKNAVGIAGLIIIILLSLQPVVKLLAIVFIYKLAGALVQPLGEESLAGALNDLGNIVLLFFLVVSAVSVMFFVCLTVVVGVANMIVMLR